MVNIKTLLIIANIIETFWHGTCKRHEPQWAGALQVCCAGVEKAFSGLNIITGSGFDLPFKDNFFDLVCTNGVLLHISPSHHYSFMKEIYRCSLKYIMGWEYYDEVIKELNYRDNWGYLWKADYAAIYKNYFPDLKIKEKHFVKYSLNDNVDTIFLLEK